MFRLWPWRLPLIVALCLAVGVAQAQPVAPLLYVYPDQSVWTTRLDAAGNPDNPLLRLAAALFAKVGVPWQATSLPASRMFESLRDGTANFSFLVNAPALAECCLVGKAPVVSTELQAWRLASSPPVRSAEDLAGHSIITIRGYSYAQLKSFLSDPARKVTVEVADTHEAAFAMLESGRAEYVIDYAGPAAEILADHPIKGVRFDTLGRLDVHMVLSRSYPGATAMMARLEAALAHLDRPSILNMPADQTSSR